MADFKAEYLACPIRQVISRFGQRDSQTDVRLLAEDVVADTQEPRALQPRPSRGFSTGAAQGGVFAHRNGQVTYALTPLSGRLGTPAFRRRCRQGYCA